MAGAGRGGVPSEGPFMLSDLTQSLQMTSHDTDSASLLNNKLDATAEPAHYFKSLPPTSLSHLPHQPQQQHSEWFLLHPPSGLKSSPSAKIKQESLGGGGEDDDDALAEDGELGPDSKKRKRNKPTLSCKECVDKKMKASLGFVSNSNFSLQVWALGTHISFSICRIHGCR
jgi:hypothetical protein